jgi:predicted DCC family thiol-disulfide oxidoreductase YuxK
MERQRTQPVVFYDAGCGLCTSAVGFITARSRSGEFRFLPLGSPEAVEMLMAGGPPGDSMVLLDEVGRHERSSAAVRIAARLDRPWSWLRFLRWVPVSVRDRIYDFIARHRIRWFGRASVSSGPDPTCGPDLLSRPRGRR